MSSWNASPQRELAKITLSGKLGADHTVRGHITMEAGAYYVLPPD